MASDRAHERFELVTVAREETLAGFADSVRSGLSSEEKSLPCRFFYDERGSQLFDEICDLAEYYPTRTERGILVERADELTALFPEPTSLVEFGSGSASKTRVLIEAFLRAHGSLKFVPIDISRSALQESSSELLDDFEDLEIRAVEGEYEKGLELIHRGSDEPRLLLWLGSSIGNLDRDEAAGFLQRVGRAMTPSEHLLVGIDLRKDRGVLERAYDDARGTTARFNLNLLVRINRELGGRFEPSSFRHRAVYDEEEGRVEMHLESRCAQQVRIEKLDLEVGFEEGERIHTECSYKYSGPEIEGLASQAGLELRRQWRDADDLFSLNLFSRPR